MLCCFSILLFAALTVPVESASSDVICGYKPSTNVFDEARVDLDFASIKERLAESSLIHARNVYSGGGHSMSVARLTLLDVPGPFSYPKGTKVHGIAKGNNQQSISGFLQKPVTWLNQRNVTVFVQYSPEDSSAPCFVGGLYTFQQASLDGCFVDGVGTVEFISPTDVAGSGELFAYTYNVRKDNMNLRTLRGFSLHSASRSKPCSGCAPHSVYKKFIEYYGDEAYADNYIMAASFGNSTTFSRFRGDADFEGASRLARAEAFLVGINALSVFMQIVIEMHRALDVCESSCLNGYCVGDGHQNAWDKSVAFFCGSKLSAEGDQDGLLIYALTQRRQREFHPTTQNSLSRDIIEHFSQAKTELSGGGCERAKKHKESIVDKLKVPLVQSVLRYAFILEQNDFKDQEEREKANALGSTYTAAILPFLHACDEAAAEALYDNMRFGSTSPSFKNVKSVLENQYHCMRVECRAVGGLWTGEHYVEGAQPCASSSASAVKSSNAGEAGGAAAGAVLAIGAFGLLVFAFQTKQKKGQQSRLSARSNIAAVSELS